MLKAARGTKEIRTYRGFTEEAVRYAERFRPNLRLVNDEITVKPRRR